MKALSRLENSYKNALKLPFDDKSKFVFFSDVHRSDNSLSDDFGRNRNIYFHAMEHYYENDFTYFEAGDGDELWEQPSYNTIFTAHPTIFYILKKFHAANRMFMLYGNHNMALSDPKYVEKYLSFSYNDENEVYEPLFPNLKVYDGIVLEHKDTKQEILVVHGHQGDLLNDQLWRISYFIIRYFWRAMHLIGVNYLASPAKNQQKRHKLEKGYNQWLTAHKHTLLICGHTHRAKFPSKDKLPYFNCGCCMNPRGITCIELVHGEMVLVDWHVHSRKDGTLYIKRTVFRGPLKISSYLEKKDDKTDL